MWSSSHGTRRDFLVGVASLAAAFGCLADARSGPRTPQVGILADPTQVEIIVKGLRTLGWRPGENLYIRSKGATHIAEARAIIADFVRLPADVLVVFTDAAASVAINATRSIPIVMVTTGAIVEDGLVESLARPDRNLTGLSFDAPREITGKRLALLKAMSPRMKCVGFLIEEVGPRGEHQRRATSPETQAAARSLGIDVVPLLFESTPTALDRALAQAVDAGADGLLVSEGVLVTLPEYQKRINEFAARHRMAVLYSVIAAARRGGLMAYGLDFGTFIARVPYFIDRILRGAKPSDLPIEQPTRLHLVVNARTARELGLNPPTSLLLHADQVIE